MKHNLKDIWTQKIADKTSGIVREGVPLKNGFTAHAGIITANGSKLFQIELNESVDIHRNYLKRFHGVEIRVIDSVKGKKDITVILSDNDLLDIFIMFLEDLIQDVENLDDEKDIPMVLNTKVNYWGKLFARINGEYLSKEAQRGLYGELTLLNELLGISTDHTNCLLSWRGPEGANQDFSNKVNALEIKTSKATSPNVNITNELQLDWTVFEHLFLAVLHVDEVNNGPDTLFKLISDIKKNINHDLRLLELFEDKLNRLGIPSGEEEKYKDLGFVIRSSNFYKVNEGFPVLTPQKIDNDAIHNVSYQIDVVAMESFRIDKNIVLNNLL